jgi:hypothetical protein
VAPIAAVPALVLPSPEPTLVRPASDLPAERLPWLADIERHIVQAELHVTRYRRVVERLGAVGVATAGVEATARLAEERLGLLHTHRQRLLEGGVGAPQPRT